MPDFDINELCQRASVTPRTVYYYVQQGLLPPAASSGPGARYGDGHTARIKLIRLLQTQHLPLAEIGKRMKGLTDQQVDALVAETKQRRAEPRGSALDYIRGVLAEPLASKLEPARPDTSRQLRFSSAGPSASEKLASPAGPTRSQWERYTLADSIELHIRRPMSRSEQRQFEKLMAAARNIFDEPQGEGQ